MNRRTPFMGPPQRAVLCLGVMSALFGSAPAEAQSAASENEITVSLELQTAPRCGSSEDLVRRVGVRSDRIRFVGAGEASRRLEATLTPSQGGIRATLTLVHANGRRSSRRLRAGSCDEALDALALVATVMLDPAATLEPLPGEEAPTPVESGERSDDVGAGRSSPATGESRSTPEERTRKKRDDAHEQNREPNRTDEPASREKPATAPQDEDPESEEPEEDVRPREPSRSDPIRLAGSIGAVGQAIAGPAPSLLPGAGLYGSLALDRRSVLSPFVRLVVTRSLRDGFAAEWGTAKIVLDAATLDVCPLRLGPREMALRACGMASTGFYRSSGSNTLDPQEDRRPWVAVGLSALLAVHPHETVEVTIGASLARPLIRDAVGFTSQTGEERVMYQVPSLTGTGTLGLGLRFE